MCDGYTQKHNELQTVSISYGNHSELGLMIFGCVRFTIYDVIPKVASYNCPNVYQVRLDRLCI